METKDQTVQNNAQQQIVVDVKEILAIISMIGELGKEVEATKQELANFQKELGASNKVKSLFDTAARGMQSLKELLSRLKGEFKNMINHAMKQGTRVFCRIVDFLNVKNHLVRLKESIEKVNVTLDKVGEIQKELQAIQSHIENIGTVVAGKETKTDKVEPEQAKETAEVEPEQAKETAEVKPEQAKETAEVKPEQAKETAEVKSEHHENKKKETFESCKKKLNLMEEKIDKLLTSIERMEKSLEAREKSSVVGKIKNYQEKPQTEAPQKPPLAKKKEEVNL